ncbi:hypothetical protein RA276_28565, partial [Pseudomonas syringae pv. tagetis]|uniref:hypothetical protein n=1 Tax=Pseudomonas syringae group genomosp. 7 TaxID=251699 RepID=UPI00376F5A67
FFCLVFGFFVFVFGFVGVCLWFGVGVFGVWVFVVGRFVGVVWLVGCVDGAFGGVWVGVVAGLVIVVFGEGAFASGFKRRFTRYPVDDLSMNKPLPDLLLT